MTGLFSPITSKIFGGLSIALALALAGTFLWGKAGWRSAEKWKDSSAKWELAQKAQEEAYVVAQESYAATARLARERQEERSAELARRADDLQADLDASRRSADSFADARRVRAGTQGAGSASGEAGTAGQGDPAPDRDRSGDFSVVLTKPEYDEFVANTLRLERVRRWGESLILEGIAVPAAEFGTPE